MSIKELDMVVLLRDVPEHRVRAGDFGTVVHMHDDDIARKDEAAMVEFVLEGGTRHEVLTLLLSEVRSVDTTELEALRRF